MFRAISISGELLMRIEAVVGVQAALLIGLLIASTPGSNFLSAINPANQTEESKDPSFSGSVDGEPAVSGSAPPKLNRVEQAEGLPMALTAPNQTARRAAIDRSLKGIWRDTPYDIVSIQYLGERLRPIGDSGAQYESSVLIKLKFPNGWLADCIGPGAAWGCQHTDSTMMQSSSEPIPVGGVRAYSGTLGMARTSQQGWYAKGSEPAAQWQQQEGEWEARVRWTFGAHPVRDAKQEARSSDRRRSDAKAEAEAVAAAAAARM